MKQAYSNRYISIYYRCSTTTTPAPPAPAPQLRLRLRLRLRQVAPRAAEPQTKKKWPAVPRAARTKRKMPAAGRSRYALPSRRSQQREASREKRDRRQTRTKGREGHRSFRSRHWSPAGPPGTRRPASAGSHMSCPLGRSRLSVGEGNTASLVG